MRSTRRCVARFAPRSAGRACGCLAMAAEFCAPAHARAVINVAWGAGNSGVWNSAGNWSPAGVPNNGVNTFNVTIAVTPVGASYTVTNSTATTIDSLAVNQANALLLHTATLFNVLGHVNLNAGTFRHTGGAIDINAGMTVGGAGVLGGAGTWDIAGGDLNNNGVIRADAGGSLTFNSGAAAGIGVWDLDGASGTGRVDASGGSITFNGTLNDAFDGTMTVGAGRTLNISGGWSLNSGTLNLNGTAAVATLTSTAGAFVMNGGAIHVDQLGCINASSLNFAGGAVTIADASDELTLGGTTVSLNGTTFSGAGRITVVAGSTLRGAGSVNVLVSNNGLVTPGASVGTLAVGSFTQGAGGGLQIELEGDAANQADRLTVAGATTLAGNLSVALLPGFQPGWGDQWTIMTYASRTGDFQTYTAPVLAPDLFWWVDAGAAACTLGVRMHADTNHDGSVNFVDLNNVLSFFGTAGSGSFGRPFSAGDANEDGLVNFIDLNIVLSFFGTSAPASAVPGPGPAASLGGLIR